MKKGWELENYVLHYQMESWIMTANIIKRENPHPVPLDGNLQQQL